MRLVSPEECPGCLYWAKSDRRPEIYAHGLRAHAVLIFDVERAAALCGDDGRSPSLVEREYLDHLLSERIVLTDHLPHVNTSKPGIMAPIGPELRRLLPELPEEILIDGGHRGTQSLKTCDDFHTYRLTPEETLRVLVEHNSELFDALGFKPFA